MSPGAKLTVLLTMMVLTPLAGIADGDDPPAASALEVITRARGVSMAENSAILVMDGTVMGNGAAAIEKVTLTPPGAPSRPVGTDSIAAILGGAGFGRPHQIHQRDGSVLVGRVSWDNATFKAAGLSTMSLTPETLDLLVLESDATPASGDPRPARCAAWENGAQEQIVGFETTTLQLTGLWGNVELPVSQIISLAPAGEPSGTRHAHLADGSKLVCWQAELKPEDDSRGRLLAMADSFQGLQQVLHLRTPPASSTPNAARIELLDGSVLLTTMDRTEFELKGSTAFLNSSELLGLERDSSSQPAVFHAITLSNEKGIPCRPLSQFAACELQGIFLHLPWHQVQRVVLQPTEDKAGPKPEKQPSNAPPAS